MRTKIAILLLAAAAAAVPLAGATGHLVNVEDQIVTGFIIQTGVNVFGGSGDTVDVGLGNYQCTDEADVVDVGVMNREGGLECASATRDGCRQLADEGSDKTGITPSILAFLGGDKSTTENPRCTDDGDAVDVSVMNEEGGYAGDRSCAQTAESPGGDVEDGVDAAALNRECRDEDDAGDVGVVNCETWDTDDGLDVGVLNTEYVDDSSDTLDVGVFNSETNDVGDTNGMNVSFLGPARVDCDMLRFQIGGPLVPLGAALNPAIDALLP